VYSLVRFAAPKFRDSLKIKKKKEGLVLEKERIKKKQEK
jgi:hypothetical protein